MRIKFDVHMFSVHRTYLFFFSMTVLCPPCMYADFVSFLCFFAFFSCIGLRT